MSTQLSRPASRGRSRRRLLACAIGLLGVAAPSAVANPGVVGEWSGVETYPVVPMSAGVLPSGKIVAWDQANVAPYFGPAPALGKAVVIDPTNGTQTRSANLAPNTLFCSLLTSLPDGRLAVLAGGIDSGSGASSKVQIFDEGTNSFSVIGQLERTRWYPGGTIDAQGNPIVAAGTSTGIERVNAATGTGSLIETSLPAHWYPDFIRTPSGSFVIEDIGDLQGQSPGRWLLNGSTLSTIGNTTLLQNRYRGLRTLIGPHKMLWTSGGTSTASMIIDASSGTPQYTAVASSQFPHMTGTSVTLPTGDVLAIGGNRDDNSTIGANPTMTPELYDVTANTWRSMANLARQRQYHSVSALLPDGRVWSAGTGYGGVEEPNGQYFSPPYLFRKDGSGQRATRPTATDAPESVQNGATFSLATGDPSRIRSASMVRIAATTHQVNAGQAYVPLTVSAVGGRVQMTAPAAAAAPPGYYMVFLIDDAGVPSVAPIVRLRSTATTALPARATQSSQQDRAWPASEAIDGVTSGAGGASGSVTQTQQESQPWWEVDLGTRRNIGALRAYLRTDCCTDRSRDLWVFASDQPITSTTVAGATAQPGVTAVRMQTPTGSVGTVTLNRTARYLRLQLPGSSAILSLAEVVPDYLPDVPVPSASSPSTSRIDVTWPDVDGETGYRLEHSASSTFTSPTGVDLAAGTTSSAITGLSPSTTRYVRVRASNAAGTTAWSSTVSATTRNAAPTVSLTAPTAGVVGDAPATLTLAANAADVDGTVGRVEFYRGATLVGTDTSAPFAATESGVAAGTYALTARAFDDDGDSATSTAVSVVVNAPPTVALTAPAAGATFTAPATVSLAATAADGDGTVAAVDFYRDSTLIASDTSSPYTATASGLAAGTYVLTARARDDRGSTTTSASRTIAVSAPNQAPTVSLTAPAAGATYTAPAAISTAANAADPDGTIARVEFLRGTTVIGTDTTAPYTASETGVPAGTYALTARAVDNAGASTTSATVTVTVSDPPNQPPTATLTGPPAGSTYTAPADVAMTASAGDGDGTVTKVEFLRDGTVVATDTSAPYTGTASGLAVGSYALAARATDDDGATTTSASRTITVEAAVGGSGPIAAYSFEETAGSVARDVSGNGHHGILTGGTWMPAGGRHGGALSLDGNDDLVTVPDAPELDLTGPSTVMTWVQLRATSSYATAILKETPGGLGYAIFATSSGGVPHPSLWTGDSGVFPGKPLPIGSWVHLAQTYDGATQRAYIDGVLVSTETGVTAPPPTSGPLRIGGNTIWPGEQLDGRVDEVRIYDRALPAAEVQRVRGEALAPESGPVLALDFDEGAGTLARDISGRGHDGAVSGAAWTTAGRRGGALDFDGLGGDRVTVPDHADLDLTNAMTLEAWVRPRSTRAWQTLVAKETTDGHSYSLYTTGGGSAQMNAWVGDAGVYAGSGTPTGRWMHVAWSYASGTGTLYLDGQPISTGTGVPATTAGTGPLQIGSNTIWANEGFDGLIDDVRIWNRGLSASEIAARAGGAATAWRSGRTATTRKTTKTRDATVRRARACRRPGSRPRNRRVAALKACRDRPHRLRRKGV